MNVYIRLSSLYFFYFASIGALMPYWGPFLAQQGFSGAQIGKLMAIILATKLVAPVVWGWVGDHWNRHVPIIRIGAVAALLAFTGVLVHAGFWWLALVMAVFSFFWNAILPQFEVVTLRALGADTHRYALIRLWGSVGFIVAVVVLGVVFDHLDLAWLPWILLLLLGSLVVASGFLKEPPQKVETAGNQRKLGEILRNPVIIALFLAFFLMQASHGPYYTFFTLYLEAQGFSRALTGQLWALGVAAEVILFLLMPGLILRFSPWWLLVAAFLLTALRWWLLATVPGSLAALLLIQTLHAASYGVYHAAAISLIHVAFPGRLQGRGQALYSSLSFGLGGAVGAIISGYLWDGIGKSAVYVFAACCAGAGFLVTLWILRRVQNQGFMRF